MEEHRTTARARQPFQDKSAPSGTRADPIQSERDLALWLSGIMAVYSQSASLDQAVVTLITDRITALPAVVSGDLGKGVLATFIRNPANAVQVITQAVTKHLETRPVSGHHHDSLFHGHHDGCRGGPEDGIDWEEAKLHR